MYKTIKHSLLIFTLFTGVNLSAQIIKADSILMHEILRIDAIDSLQDYKIYDADSLQSAYLTETYIHLPVKIIQDIYNGNFIVDEKKVYSQYLYEILKSINSNNYKNISFYNKKFKQIHLILSNVDNKKKLKDILESDVKNSLAAIAWFNAQPIVDSFLMTANYFYPDEVLKAYDDFKYIENAPNYVIAAAKFAPQTAKKYIISGNPIYDVLRKSSDTAIKTILQINYLHGKKSQAYVLLDEILNGKITIGEADSLASNKLQWFNRLLAIRSRKNIVGEYSVDKELEENALKFVRQINDLHNENDNIRFAVANGFSAQQLYTLIVYSEEEIFTSTFNGLFNRLIKANGPKNGYKLLESVNNNRFRTFIKQSASFGKLSEFLQTMTFAEKEILLRKFVSDLGNSNSPISEAVEVADAFVSIKDTATRNYLTKVMNEELNSAIQSDNKKGKTIYSLLISLTNTNGMFNQAWYQEIANQYSIPNINSISIDDLKEKNNAIVWQMYFYDDEDGDMSFKNFIKIFTDKNWLIKQDDSTYITIESKTGTPIYIYANKPVYEYEGQAKVEKLLEELQMTPDVLIHRGHSYYAPKTVEKTKSSAKIFILGSCGGYNLLSSIIDRAPGISIVSSKQIGTYQVNNPMLKIIAENMREGKKLDWQKVWTQLDTSLKNTAAYQRFVDYIPPHKNLGAIFIKAYMNTIAKNE